MSAARVVETPGQAHAFQGRLNRYRIAGLCDACAAQAAYGHLHGFSQVHPPCKLCRSIVSEFPKVKPNGWRALDLGRAQAISPRVPEGRGTRTRRGARTSVSGPYTQPEGHL